MGQKGKNVKNKSGSSNIETQKFELIKLRIKNKYYDRDEIIKRVVQEICECDIKKKIYPPPSNN